MLYTQTARSHQIQIILAQIAAGGTNLGILCVGRRDTNMCLAHNIASVSRGNLCHTNTTITDISF